MQTLLTFAPFPTALLLLLQQSAVPMSSSQALQDSLKNLAIVAGIYITGWLIRYFNKLNQKYEEVKQSTPTKDEIVSVEEFQALKKQFDEQQSKMHLQEIRINAVIKERDEANRLRLQLESDLSRHATEYGQELQIVKTQLTTQTQLTVSLQEELHSERSLSANLLREFDGERTERRELMLKFNSLTAANDLAAQIREEIKQLAIDLRKSTGEFKSA